MNKPKVDWKQIICKCQEHFNSNSKAAWFCREQLSTFESHFIWQEIKANRDAKNGHGNPFPKNRVKKNESVEWFRGQPDLYCDDPLYDDVIPF